MNENALRHIASVADEAGVKFDRARIGQSVRLWLGDPTNADRLRIEAVDGGAFKSFGDGWAAWNALTQPIMTGVYAVTSLSPKKQHQKNQPKCLDSWKRFGLEIVSVNTSEEIAELRDIYPQVTVWHECNDQGAFYKKPTQRINCLIDVAVWFERSVLLLNSDIEIYGDQSKIEAMVQNGTSAIGIRYNYEGTQGSATIEPYGLDAILIQQEVAERLDRVPFSIGKPIWDYWLAWNMNGLGIKIEWIGEPLFYHELHPINWTQAEWSQGSTWFIDRYREAMNWLHWRQSMPFPPGHAPEQKYKPIEDS